MRLFSCSLSLSRRKDIESADPSTSLEKDIDETLGVCPDRYLTIPPLPFEIESKKMSIPPDSNPLLKKQAKMRELLEEYDPRPKDQSIIPKVFPMSQHRHMMRTMYLDNILHATASLHRHLWIVAATNERFTSLQTQDRWNKVHNDLMRYTKAIKSYEFWLSSIIGKMEINKEAIPPDFDTYGRTLAILECASNNPSKQAEIAELSQFLTNSYAKWSHSASHSRHLREQSKKAQSKKSALCSRMIAATFGGLTLIIPMLIMVLDQRKLTTVLTTSLFTLAMGLILAIMMKDAHNKDILAATAAYAAVLVVFVGSGTNT